MSKQWGLHEWTLLALLTILMGVGWYLDPAFVSANVQLELSRNMWVIALVAMPMMMVVLTGGIDLSVGSAVALCAVGFGMVFNATGSLLLAVLTAVGLGLCCGALNGWFVSRFNIHPLIVTLATLAAYRGIAEGVSRAESITGFPPRLVELGTGTWLGIPPAFFVFVVVAAFCALLLLRRSFGRALYMIGLNEKAVVYSAIDVKKIKLALYSLSGLVVSIAAILLVARNNSAKANLGTGLELVVITAVVLGGVSIYGGRGTIPGVILGVLLVHETKEFISWNWNLDELNLIVIGALLILSVLVQTVFQKRKS